MVEVGVRYYSIDGSKNKRNSRNCNFTPLQSRLFIHQKQFNTCDAKFGIPEVSILQVYSPKPEADSLPPNLGSSRLPLHFLHSSSRWLGQTRCTTLCLNRTFHVHIWESLAAWRRGADHSLNIVTTRADQECRIIVRRIIRSYSWFSIIFPACFQTFRIEGINVCSI